MIVSQSASGTSQMVASVSVSEGVEGVFFILPKIIGAKTNAFEIDSYHNLEQRNTTRWLRRCIPPCAG